MTEQQPLAGVRIVDFTHDWAGPHATRVLADYGADVIKVEYPRRLCGMRGAYLDRINAHPRWWQINRNKRSIMLDLHRADHVQAVKDLVRSSDVVIDNSRPGVMERFGLGYEALQAVKSDIIVLSMSAFGASGPESSYAGYGGAIEAISGAQSLTAYDRGGDPLRVREIDVANGVMGACAIMTALVARSLTGEGQFIDLSQREATTWLIGEFLLEHAINEEQVLPVGNRHRAYAPQGCYRCKGDDRWLVITIRTDAEWSILCRTIGRPEWSRDARFKNVEGRREHHDKIDRMIESWATTMDNHQAMTLLQASRLAAGVVHDCAGVASDPHLHARGWFAALPGEEKRAYPGFPFRIDGGPGSLRRRGPDLGADNGAILGNELGWTADRLAALHAMDLGTAYDLETAVRGKE